jgi:hypothetical protein
MAEHEFTLIESGRATTVAARRAGGRIRVPAADVERALGWKLAPEGLCRGDVCVPVRRPAELASAEGLDLEVLAELLGRPLATDPEEGVAVLGAGAAQRRAVLASLEAPDFALPDLAGKLHRLSDQRGKKVLLIAYASW